MTPFYFLIGACLVCCGFIAWALYGEWKDMR